MVGRRGDLSSPVVLCNLSYLQKQKNEGKVGTWKNENIHHQSFLASVIDPHKNYKHLFVIGHQ